MKYYTGIGARRTPPAILNLITRFARVKQAEGMTLRSGGATGADTAFEYGAGDSKEIFTMDDWSLEAEMMAALHHPKWTSLSTYVKRLMTRNVFQVLGRNLDSPSDYLICWTADGKASGGTGQAIRIANTFDIPVINIKGL